MLRHVEIGRHAALAVHAILKSDKAQRAGKLVAPGMIETVDTVGPAARLDTQHGAFVGAPIHQRVQVALFVARDDDRSIAHICSAETTRLGEFGFQAKIVPHWSAEDSPLLFLIDLRIRHDPVRRAGIAFKGPM